MLNNAYFRLPAVKAYTGLSTSSIWRLEQEKLFPSRIRIGKRAVGWLKTDIERWINNPGHKNVGIAE